MIEFITQNKGLVIAAAIAVLLFNNREKFSFLYTWPSKVIGFFNFKARSKNATPDDRKNLYDCLIQLQDYLAVCGIDRQTMDSLTLSEVGELTVSATTPLKPSLTGSCKKNGTAEHSDAKLLDGV